MALEGLRVALGILGSILIAGYILINIAVDLPLFLFLQNITYAALYAITILTLYRRGDPAPLAALSLFNLGRVSRSIIGPDGSIGRLALEHIPLFTLIALVSILSIAYHYLRRT